MLVFTPVNSIAIRWGFSFGIMSKQTTPINKHTKKKFHVFILSVGNNYIYLNN